MADKSIDWRPGPTVCRCCLTEGCYKDISTEYFWMGKREVYSEMLSDTFDLSISYSQSGGPNSNSRLICEPCISRLRDATDFKRQVVECEKTFKQLLDPTSSTSQLDVTFDSDKDVKLEKVKLEKNLSDDEDFLDDAPGFGDDDDDDDLDDQPLTKLATKIPKTEAVDLLDLLDNKDVSVKRKSTTKSKVPVKKAKTVVKPSPSKIKVKPEPKKKKDESYDDPAARRNAELILRFTTAYPFRVNDKCILCAYCRDVYSDPDVFRAHMSEEHEKVNLKVAFYSLPKKEFVKADITILKCRICEQQYQKLDAIAEHLKSEHNKPIEPDEKLGVMPYYLKKDKFNCAVCDKSVPSLLHLNRHTVSHFFSYVCHVCGSSYVASTGLLRHVRTKHQAYEVKCKKCRRTFPSIEAKDRHRRTEKMCMAYCCGKCPERFFDSKSKKRHQMAVHGEEAEKFRCIDCDVTFQCSKAYYEHFRLQHSDDCPMCKYCGLKFTNAYRLKRHLAKHEA